MVSGKRKVHIDQANSRVLIVTAKSSFLQCAFVLLPDQAVGTIADTQSFSWIRPRHELERWALCFCQTKQLCLLQTLVKTCETNDRADVDGHADVETGAYNQVGVLGTP